MYAIYGRMYYAEEPDVVFTFDSEEAARKYLNAAKLKSPRYGKVFRMASGLYIYSVAWVDYLEEPDAPHNPEITW